MIERLVVNENFECSNFFSGTFQVKKINEKYDIPIKVCFGTEEKHDLKWYFICEDTFQEFYSLKVIVNPSVKKWFEETLDYIPFYDGNFESFSRKLDALSLFIEVQFYFDFRKRSDLLMFVMSHNIFEYETQSICE